MTSLGLFDGLGLVEGGGVEIDSQVSLLWIERGVRHFFLNVTHFLGDKR